MDVQSSEVNAEFLQAFKGSFTSALRWHHLDDLWQQLTLSADEGWYVYHIGDPPPDNPIGEDKILDFIEEIDRLLRKEHEEDYCGIVYADDLQKPTFIKIYDPNNLGVSCGYSDNPPLPGWILSQLKPCNIPAAQKPTNSRKRWWQSLFSR